MSGFTLLDINQLRVLNAVNRATKVAGNWY